MSKFKVLFLAFACLGAQSGSGFTLEGEAWTANRTVVMQLSLGAAKTLTDGSSSFNQSAQDALNIWNPYLAHMRFAATLFSPVVPASGDDENSAFFAADVFGDKFGSSALAVTLLSFRGAVFEESDTVFNTAYSWDSYRGVLAPVVLDFRRVALHEFGHALGLDHPDQDGQQVAAIMNSRIGDLDTLQPDDIAGAQAIYSTGPAYLSSPDAPVLKNLSTRGFINTGENLMIGGFIVQGTQPATVILRGIGPSLAAIPIAGLLDDPMITVYDSNQHVVASNDDWFTSPDAETIASYHLDPPNSRESAVYLTLQPGAYTAVVQNFTNAQQPPASGVGLFELYDLSTSGGRAGNISTRAQVLGGTNVLIGGTIIGGTDPKTVVLRALGPSLGAAGISSPLSDPTLELRNSDGTLLQSNNNWQEGPNAQAIIDQNLAPTNAKESALLATLAPGAYTAIVQGVGGATGVALVEVYDTSPSP
ncbi:MAG: matrixin family metalloprotease [Chthoniobacterales bacterium]